MLLRMLSLGDAAWSIMDSQQYSEPRLPVSMVTDFMAALLDLHLSVQLNTVLIRLQETSVSCIVHGDLTSRMTLVVL